MQCKSVLFKGVCERVALWMLGVTHSFTRSNRFLCVHSKDLTVVCVCHYFDFRFILEFCVLK